MSAVRTIAVGLAYLFMISEAAKLRRHADQLAKLDITKGKFVVALDKDMKTQMLVQLGQKSSQPIKDPCSGITCGALTCPAGFMPEEVEGHCCAYCVNPNIKVEDLVKGASGEHGGKASTFCKDVWCFPTMCTKTETAPTTTNGMCCPACAAL